VKALGGTGSSRISLRHNVREAIARK